MKSAEYRRRTVSAFASKLPNGCDCEVFLGRSQFYPLHSETVIFLRVYLTDGTPGLAQKRLNNGPQYSWSHGFAAYGRFLGRSNQVIGPDTPIWGKSSDHHA